MSTADWHVYADPATEITDATDSAAPMGPRLAPVDLSTLMTQDWPAQRAVFDPILPRRVVTLLGGHGGIGKSMLGLILAAHAACGRKWGPFDVVLTPSVYVSLEDEAAVVRYRLRQIVDTYSLAPGDVASGLRVFDGSGADATLAVEVMADGVRALQPAVGMDLLAQVCKGAGLIVIDNASDAYAGNENERRQVRAFIRMLTQLARDNDAAVLLLAHIDKSAAKFGSNGNTYSGSTAWHNSVRSRLALVKEDHVMRLVHEKANFSTAADPVPLAFVGHGVLWPQDEHATAATAETQARTDADGVLDAIKAALAAGRVVGANATGPASTWTVLEPFPELPRDLKTKDGKARVRAAVVQLERAHQIVKVPYKDAYRKQRERYELAQVGALESARVIPPVPPTRTSARAEGALVRTGALVQNSRTTRALAQGEAAFLVNNNAEASDL